MPNDKNAVRKILDQAKAAGRESLTAPEARGICEAYGITSRRKASRTRRMRRSSWPPESDFPWS